MTGETGPAQAGSVVSGVTAYPDSIWAIDTHYVRPRLDASHLVVENGRAAFVDTGAAPAVPLLLDALRSVGLAPESVDWIWLTHIHLDHAGGAGALLEHLPNARVVVHPRGAAHLVDPSRLVAATRAVYGDAAYERLYGEIRPIPADRLLPTDDGTTVSLSNRMFRCLHTPGHALHHQVFHDQRSGCIFTGDTFGISYREFDVNGRPFILPTTTPTQFDPEQLMASVERVLALDPPAVYLTHYGRVEGVDQLGAALKSAINAYVMIARRYSAASDLARLSQDLFEWTCAELDRHGDRSGREVRRALLAPDMRLNADGLAAWLRRSSSGPVS
jgi:glyoxylase-like metal-dependent hydrolase (beta-lactamase superfamily II)